MENTEKRISTAQLFAVIFTVGMAMKMLMLPVLLLKSSGRDSVLVLSAILLLELVCLITVTAALAIAPQKSFPALLERAIGKVATKIVCVILALFFALKLLLLSGEVRIFFTENLFSDFPWRVLGIPFFALTAVIGMGTARSLGRTVQFLFPLILGVTLFLFLIIGGGIDYSEVLPLGEFGARHVMSNVVRYAMWYGDYSVLVVFMGSLKRTKRTAALSITAGVAASVAVLFFMVSLAAAYSNLCSLIRYGQNVTGMSHYARGNVSQGRFDLVLYCAWMLSLLLKGGLFSFAAVYFWRYVLPQKPALSAVIVNALLWAVSAFWGSATALHMFMANFAAVPAMILQFALPLAALITALCARRKQKKQGGNETCKHSARAAEEEKHDAE